MVYRLILPDWVKQTTGWNSNELPPSMEAEFTDEQVQEWNSCFYNCYYLPNFPSEFNPDVFVTGADVDTFNCVFVDLDMKDYQSSNADRRHEYATKDEFVTELLKSEVEPSMIVDSGNGVHAYWDVRDLTDKDYLRFQRRLARRFKTDPAVSTLNQLMRVPGTINWKNPDEPKLAEVLFTSERTYTAEELNKLLPRISDKDEAYCVRHYDTAHGLGQKIEISEELPAKWFKLAKKGTEAHRLFYERQKDRSQADYRLGYLMQASSFSKLEAMAVLAQTNKASERSGTHRMNYAQNIVDKIWDLVPEETKEAEKPNGTRIRAATELIAGLKDGQDLKGVRFECDPIFDATTCGFRLGHVFGEVAGAGVGKTTFGFNIFLGFIKHNPEYIHVAVPLEEPELEYIARWKKMVGDDPFLTNKLYVLGNHNEDGSFRNLSLVEIEDEVKELERVTGKKVGAVMIDHVGVLKKENRNGHTQGLIDIFIYMKPFAVNTKTFLIMQSQAPREKASIGDVELDKDAAYGSVFFESFCDWLVTIWQPLKRIYHECPHMTVTIFKFCKIRHKNVLTDKIKEDQRYPLMLDPTTDLFRELTQEELKHFEFFNKKATTARNKDKKREPGAISAIDWTRKGVEDGNGNATSHKGLGKPGAGKGIPTKP